ncbi:hypothetical protein AOLI_G00072320 [Acnodon oligacanthus]
MDQVLQGLPNVQCYLDDILITGQDHVQHLRNLDAVLGCLEEFGLRVEKEKCEFFKDSLEHLGHTINAHGLHKSPENVRAIVEAPAPTDEKSREVDRFHIRHLEVLPVKCKEICRESRTDRVLAQMVSTGHFPRVQDGDSTLAPFISRKSELTLQQGCLMWGIRVVIPPKLRPRVLSELHNGHPGVVKMKAVACSYMWWPGIDAQTEQVSKTCQACQLTQKAPGPSPLHPWARPGSPWRRIHIDFADPFQGHMFMVVVDAHSKWPEVHLMSSTSASKTIQVFSRYELPEVLVSDNGPQFTSGEFKTFMKSNGVKHIHSAPFHPSTNGLAEHFVQAFKNSLKRPTGTASIQQRLDAFLLMYHNTLHSTTKETPSMLFMGRKLHSRLDLLKPDVTSEVEKAQLVQCTRREVHAKARSFKIGDKVLVRDYGREEKWTSISRDWSCVTVNIGSSEHWRRHADQMLARHAELDASANGEPTSSYAPAELPVLENTVPKPDTYPSPKPVNVSSPQVTSEETNTQPQDTAK